MFWIYFNDVTMRISFVLVILCKKHTIGHRNIEVLSLKETNEGDLLHVPLYPLEMLKIQMEKTTIGLM